MPGMDGRGRPPKPTELKRRLGQLPPEPDDKVIKLPRADGIPPAPQTLGQEGLRLWQSCWDAAIIWLAPLSDSHAVERACQLADDLAMARTAYENSKDPADGRLVVAFSHELGIALSQLGFDPTSRSRLGVEAIEAASKLDKLRR